MRKTILGCVTLLVLLCGAPAFWAQTATISTKADKVRKILIMTDAPGAFTREFAVGLEKERKATPSVPARFWDELQKAINVDELMELMIPVYEPLFSNNELSELIAFYETPLGKKLIASTPQIITASRDAGAKYGEALAQKVITRMRAEGTWPATPPNPPAQPKP
jgi:hypothetical protein